MPSKTAESHSRRLFVAIWPDRQVAAEFARVAEPYLGRGRPVGKDRLHLTLAFLGALSDAQTDTVVKALADVDQRACSLVLDQVGHFRRGGILWLGSSDGQPALEKLSASVRTVVGACGLAIEKRSFRPHVTIARKCWRAPYVGPVTPVVWSVDQFSLIESTLHPSGSRYRLLNSWPLATPER